MPSPTSPGRGSPSSSSPARTTTATPSSRSTRLGADALRVWHTEPELPAGTAGVVLPGGFSYGDYLRCGAIARFSPIMGAVAGSPTRAASCSESATASRSSPRRGLLPGALRPNESLSFVCRDVPLRVDRADSPFTSRCCRGPDASRSR